MSDQKESAEAVRESRTAGSAEAKYIGRIAGILLAICVVTALLLGIVNQVTAPRIASIRREKKEAAMSQVLPADEYILWTGEIPEGGGITGIYQANIDGAAIGWVVEATAAGSQGPISMMVGVDMSDPFGKVTGVCVISSGETPNIGTKVVGDPSVLGRFTGMSHADGEITVNAGANRFDGVAGATVSSRGVTAGVNAALDAVDGLYAEGTK